MGLLGGAYLLMALTLAALFWRSGAGLGVGAAVLVGTLGLFVALHGLVARAMGERELRRELGRLREAHLMLADQLEETQATLAGMGERIEVETAQRTQELAGEVHVLEALVARLSDDMEDRLEAIRRAPSHSPRFDHQAAALLETVRSALADNRVDLYLQPVVSLPQRRVVFYESYSRLRDDSGRVLMPAEYLPAAEGEGLMPAIDNLLLFRCVQIVRRLAKQDRKIGIFCNLSPASLADEQFFPQFLDFMGRNRDLSGAVIFELGQAAFRERGSTQARNMAKLADLGFRFSLDKVVDLELDFSDLARSDVKFIKIGAEVLLSQLLDNEGRAASRAMRDLHASDFAALTRRYGVEAIAEKVENERQVIDILELDLAYGQGNLFGEPRAIKEAVLAETAPPPDFLLRRSSAERRAN